MNRFFRHWGLVNAHRFRVFVNGCHCGIGFHCLFHDLSKYGPTEFFRSVKFFDGTHSPVLEERLEHNYFSLICQHHTRRNKHHWEYWVDFFQGNIIALTMPWKYAVEYVCDMLSASYCYDPKGFTPEKTLLYYEARCDHYYMSDATREYVRWCLARFRDYGFAGLKKKDTQKAYEEIKAKYPEVRVYHSTVPVSDLPANAKEFIIRPSQQGDHQ